MTKKIQIHIDELVLHGFSRADAPAIGDAVREEISRLIELRGLSPGLVDIDRIDAGEFFPAPGTRPASIGSQVGRSVYKGLTRRI